MMRFGYRFNLQLAGISLAESGFKGWIVQFAAFIRRTQETAYGNQSQILDIIGRCSFCNGANRTVQHLFIRPGSLVNDSSRFVRAISAADQFFLQLIQHAGAEEDDHGRMMFCVIFNLLFRRNSGPAFHPGNNHRLADVGQCIFRFQRSRCRAEGTDTGHNFKIEIITFQKIHLFPVGAVYAGIPCMQTHYQFAFLGSRNHGGNHFFQRHDRAVQNLTLRFGIVQQSRIHQRTGVNNHVCLFQQFFTANRN